MKRAALLWLATVAMLAGHATAAQARTLPNISGTWYAQGDHSKRCRITQSGNSITLTNERGETATGHFMNPSVIKTSWPKSAYTSVGPRTEIEGRISGNLSTILWSNSTTWTRQPTGKNTLPDLSGTWYAMGDPSKTCRIRQRNNSLTLTNESGQTATGTFKNSRTITATWSGQRIEGRISPDFWRIDWSNHTRWTRSSY